MKQYVYIMANARPTLYIGVTSDLEKRIFEHRNELMIGFTSTYHTHKLVYFEITNSIESAIIREKQLKSWKRQWKLDLISSINPSFEDLSKRILNRVQDDSEGFFALHPHNPAIPNRKAAEAAAPVRQPPVQHDKEDY